MTCRRILVFLLLFMWHGEISPQPNTSASVNEIPPQTTVERNGAEGTCTVPGRAWSHIAAPEDAGWSSEKLSVARKYCYSIQSSSVMIVQRGKIVDEWGDARKKITFFSVRKSLISALYGVYSAEGAVDADETLEQLGVNDSPDPLNRAEQQARVVDLLRARSGVYHPVDFETDYQIDSATDNAPLDMYDTTVMLKPRTQWRLGMTYETSFRKWTRNCSFLVCPTLGPCRSKIGSTWS